MSVFAEAGQQNQGNADGEDRTDDAADDGLYGHLGELVHGRLSAWVSTEPHFCGNVNGENGVDPWLHSQREEFENRTVGLVGPVRRVGHGG